MNNPRPLDILIIEDDQKIAEIQQRFLERITNVSVIGIAHTLTDAQDLIDVFQPQLILLDVYLPDGNGLERLQQWRSQHQKMDVILITAAKEIEAVRSAMHAGAFEYILKPLVFARLEEAISRYRDHLSTLESTVLVDQENVDTIIGKSAKLEPGVESKARLPKGIDPITLKKIRVIIADGRPYTAEQLGQVIGASRTTARRYLEYLVSDNSLTAEVEYGTVGRPERRYMINSQPPAAGKPLV